jgi:hypothetical protein
MEVINLFMISEMNYFFLKLVYIRNIEFVNEKKKKSRDWKGKATYNFLHYFYKHNELS